MTKQEAKDTGTNRGIAYANLFTDDVLRAGLDATRDDIKDTARDKAIDAGFRSIDSANAITFIDAFVHAAQLRFLGRRNELPDVKAEERFRWVDRRLTRTIEDAQARLAQFQQRLAENALDAFEWSEDAFAAAAKLHVAKHMAAIIASVEGHEEGIEKALTFARHRMTEGARYPSRSTSDASNLAKQYKTAAYAEFVAETE